MELWEFSWEYFTQMPSRKCVEPVRQQERDRLLATAASKGYIDNYTGIRISRTGKRFQTELQLRLKNFEVNLRLVI